MLRFRRFVAAILLALAGGPTALAQHHSWYAEVALSVANFEVREEPYNPGLLRLQAGWFLRDGISLLGQISTGISDDSALGFDAEIDLIASWFLRFDSPERDGFRLSIYGGYSHIELSLAPPGGGSPGDETFAQPAIGLGLAQRLGTGPWSITADLLRHYDDEGVDVQTLSLGLQRDF